MSRLAPQVDLILELRDARAPIATTNVMLDKVFKGKEKIILYTKSDLASTTKREIDKWNVNKETWTFYQNKSEKSINQVMKLLKDKYMEMYPPPPLGLRLMIVGMPNVGKSSITNMLRSKMLTTGYKSKKPVAHVSKMGGTTRKLSEIIRICSEPEILMYDTPGVLLPQVKDVTTMLTLSLIRSVSFKSIDPVISADYLLFAMNLMNPSGKHYSCYLNKPTNDILELLKAVCIKRNMFIKRKRLDDKNKYEQIYNYNEAALQLTRDLHDLKFGKLCLDYDILKDKIEELPIEEKRMIVDAEKERFDAMEKNPLNRPVDKSKPKTPQQRRAQLSNQLFQ
ncbi:hypothetical protein CANARDRAFT_29882 [[Candida] arabinofermentans NRRL YB-2248]|uniref:G domain-containing protein n=1 Tax=[Candida] arabinofermentans NRRL YB-2248 TaxID=983967 RepID=A0A1E4SW06_9ASCO|nr:hypothetical protein CANARDRAFT_29882 [[Candida] arabinofermentans NRRL YB-2248]